MKISFQIRMRLMTKTIAASSALVLTVAVAAAAPGREHLTPPHRRHIARVAAPRAPVPPALALQGATVEPKQGVVGYFGPRPFVVEGPFGQGYGYGPRGDLGFGLLGLLNGGGLRGLVECGNYYARTPGACGF